MTFTPRLFVLRRLIQPAIIILWLAVLPSLALSAPTYILTADGLACPFCAYGIEKQLGKIDGVDTVTTDIASGTVTVVMADDGVLNRQDADSAVTKAGFTLRDFRQDDTAQ